MFFLDLVTNFFTEYHYSGSDEVERDLRKIFVIYLKGRFTLDFIAILPLHFFVQLPEQHLHLVYLAKLTRLYVCFELLDHKNFMKQIK